MVWNFQNKENLTRKSKAQIPFGTCALFYFDFIRNDYFFFIAA
jgi:hypothetical protein